MFDKLSDIVVYDRVAMFLRFYVVYILSNSDREFKLKIRLNVNERNSILTSISTIVYSSNWAEREAMDLFGVRIFWSR
jgi:NADH:ubiquinone oxidoreductase subunit C